MSLSTQFWRFFRVVIKWVGEGRGKGGRRLAARVREGENGEKNIVSGGGVRTRSRFSARRYFPEIGGGREILRRRLSFLANRNGREGRRECKHASQFAMPNRHVSQCQTVGKTVAENESITR